MIQDMRITPVKPLDRVKQVTKLENGDLEVTQHSGKTFRISQNDNLFQSFLVWMMLNEDA